MAEHVRTVHKHVAAGADHRQAFPSRLDLNAGMLLPGTGFHYTAVRRRALPKLEVRKHDPVVNRHVLFTETKTK
ncbi:hypothetical protein CXG81DRAFT_26558 [Caulochytrium protostelioides]|uniref:Large ribosomal subunit protein bL33m n=1 Tax=Caulochytrium protostelioides TaxID=1555241 RepID=A0A4P9X6F0_9FUNG|nr:hypothetical protein CXG81DRAFT_26558 [Caulochytrium protostelioides]|eukprot:RKP00732.1 hypothetical protein CXG81DRAFT_26558 [Caulochytrium protostelioides]